MDNVMQKKRSALASRGWYWRAAVLFFFLSACFSTSAFGTATEEILDFSSRIQIHTDGTMTVTEAIQVTCTGQKIKRGIFRDFPTRYKDGRGQTMRVRFQVVEVLRDNRPEAYHTERRAEGVRVYIGQEHVRLSPGVYTYSLTYRTDRQLGFYKEFDELYWNVTGNDWEFPIRKASAVVKLPPRADILQKAAYTGRRGKRGKAFIFGTDEVGNLAVNTTRTLLPGEGLTLAVAWPKGMVREPDPSQKIGYFIRDHQAPGSALIGLCMVFLYYSIVWLKVGKDPEKGTIIPRFHPPHSLSPAAVRYITRMRYDKKTFAAALINMAVNGIMKITRNDEGEYTLKKSMGNASGLSNLEKRTYKRLFPHRGSLELKKKNRTTILGAEKKLKSGLKLDCEKIYFLSNRRYFFPGLGLTLVTLVATVLTAYDRPTALGVGLWLSLWSLGCGLLAFAVISAWKTVIGTGDGKVGAIVLTLFALPFFGGWVLGAVMLSSMISPLAAAILLITVFLNVLFFHLLKAPTPLGRRVMDEIEGFKQYLTVAEAERLKALKPPEKTAALFEKLLPYALALGVEQEWSEQFSQVLAQARPGDSYRPAWYRGVFPDGIQTSGLVSDLSQSLVGAVSSASTAPGSSSGSGGGGSSGGGGGGGGGGGW